MAQIACPIIRKIFAIFAESSLKKFITVSCTFYESFCKVLPKKVKINPDPNKNVRIKVIWIFGLDIYSLYDFQVLIVVNLEYNFIKLNPRRGNAWEFK
jgi:hypothetical protein